MAARKTCEDCGAPLEPRPRIRFCPECVAAHKRKYKSQKYRVTRHAGHTAPEKIYKVVSCPDNEWPCNCQLVKTDVEITLKTGHFPPGMVFERSGRRLRVCGDLFSKQYLVEVW